MKKVLCVAEDYVIRELDAENLNLHELSRFVITEYYKHHGKTSLNERFDDDIDELFAEESLYARHSKYFVTNQSKCKHCLSYVLY